MLTVDKIVADKLKESTDKENKRKNTLKMEVPRLTELFGDGEIEVKIPDMEILASIGERKGDVDYMVEATLISPKLEEVMGVMGAKTKTEALKKLFTKDEIMTIAGHLGNSIKDEKVKIKK